MLASGLWTEIVDPEKGGGILVHERLDWEPEPIDDGVLCAVAKACAEEMAGHLTPIEPQTLGATIGKLLAHFERRNGRDDRDPALLEALLVDWIEDLVEYPRWAVDRACADWRRNNDWRPTIASIRRLCEAEVAADRRTMRLLTKVLQC